MEKLLSNPLPYGIEVVILYYGHDDDKNRSLNVYRNNQCVYKITIKNLLKKFNYLQDKGDQNIFKLRNRRFLISLPIKSDKQILIVLDLNLLHSNPITLLQTDLNIIKYEPIVNESEDVILLRELDTSKYHVVSIINNELKISKIIDIGFEDVMFGVNNPNVVYSNFNEFVRYDFVSESKKKISNSIPSHIINDRDLVFTKSNVIKDDINYITVNIINYKNGNKKTINIDAKDLPYDCSNNSFYRIGDVVYILIPDTNVIITINLDDNKISSNTYNIENPHTIATINDRGILYTTDKDFIWTYLDYDTNKLYSIAPNDRPCIGHMTSDLLHIESVNLAIKDIEILPVLQNIIKSYLL